jgi:DNA-binding HxlR family transcriptional regulator
MARVVKRLPSLPPAERALKVISGRWKAVVVYHLFEGPRRLSELRRLAPSVSQKVLVQQLREMEAHGLVTREIFRQVPPRVDYSLTTLGQSLAPIVAALCEWGRRHAAELDELDRVAECDPSQPYTRSSRDTATRLGPTAPRVRPTAVSF